MLMFDCQQKLHKYFADILLYFIDEFNDKSFDGMACDKFRSPKDLVFLAKHYYLRDKLGNDNNHTPRTGLSE